MSKWHKKQRKNNEVALRNCEILPKNFVFCFGVDWFCFLLFFLWFFVLVTFFFCGFGQPKFMFFELLLIERSGIIKKAGG